MRIAQESEGHDGDRVGGHLRQAGDRLARSRRGVRAVDGVGHRVGDAAQESRRQGPTRRRRCPARRGRGRPAFQGRFERRVSFREQAQDRRFAVLLHALVEPGGGGADGKDRRELRIGRQDLRLRRCDAGLPRERGERRTSRPPPAARRRGAERAERSSGAGGAGVVSRREGGRREDRRDRIRLPGRRDIEVHPDSFPALERSAGREEPVYRPLRGRVRKESDEDSPRGPEPASRDSSGSHLAIAARSVQTCQRTPFHLVLQRGGRRRDAISSLSDERSIASAAVFLANRPLLERSPERTR